MVGFEPELIHTVHTFWKWMLILELVECYILRVICRLAQKLLYEFVILMILEIPKITRDKLSLYH